ncbi:hypothetical protein HYDPIDRAFT_110111 [Hydnomerulius pinastri MD-312]|nr:hypothetical protein HYDPIDRAFT_110111 [Hydnomerulius pinastri MD-312]
MLPSGNENSPPAHGPVPKTPGGPRQPPPTAKTTGGGRAVTKQVLQEQNGELRDENGRLKGKGRYHQYNFWLIIICALAAQLQQADEALKAAEKAVQEAETQFPSRQCLYLSRVVKGG